MLQKTKSLLTKCLAFLFIVCCVVAATVGMVACSNEVTIASIKLNDGKLVVTYTDGNTDSLKITADAVTPEACKHANTKNIELSVDGCDHHYLLICADCGAVAGDDTVAEHTWSEKEVTLSRLNCLIPARTAIVCTVCGTEKEGSVNFLDKDHDGEVKEHKVVEVTYLLDKNHADDACVCESETVHAKVCSVCNETIEVLDVTPAPGHKFGDWAVATAPTATTEGTVTRKCTVCGNKHIDADNALVYSVIPALYVLDDDGHATTKINAHYTYVEGDGDSCSTDGRIDNFTFTAPDGKTLSIEKTVKTKHVLVLGNKIVEIDTTEPIEVSDYYEGKLEYIGSTLVCKEAGIAGFFKCEECDKNIDIKVRKAHVAFDVKNQTEAQKNNSKAATCIDAGYNLYTCSVCTTEVKDPVAKLDHKLVCTKVVAPAGTVTTWTFELECGRLGCTASIDSVVTEKAPTITEVAATCEENAATVYSNIIVKDGDKDVVLTDDDGKPAKFSDEKDGTALGHLNAVLGEAVADDAAFDLRKTKASAFEYIGVVNCGTNSETNPAQGFFKCDRCGTNRPVKVYYSHSGETKTTKYATCTEDGELTIVECDDCDKVNTTEVIKKLGHEYIYSISKVGDVLTVTRSCIRVNKTIKGAGTTEDPYKTDETACTHSESVVGVKNAEVVSKATCKEYGKAKLTFNDDSTEIVNLAKSYHILNGEEMVCSYDHPYSPDKEGVQFTGDKPTCKDFLSTDKENGFFKCDVCKIWAPIYVKTEHTKPANYDATSDVFYKAPTCESAGYEKYTCAAADCGASVNKVIKALGHDVEWKLVKVDGLKATVALRCKRADCAQGASFDKILEDTVTYSANISEFDLTDYFSAVDGKAKVDIDKAKTDGLNIATVVAGTCTTKGVYKVTVIVPDDATIVLSSDITFEVTYDVAHVTEGSTITWVLDGVQYTGKYCKVCGNVVVTKAVKVA